MNFFTKSIDIEKMKETGKRLADVFNKFKFSNFIGKNTKQIDNEIFSLLESRQLISQSYGYNGFNGYSCLSINDELVHGIPSENKIIKEKDLLKVDICAKYNGWCADMARMYANFEDNNLYTTMKECAEESLNIGIESIFDGNKIGTVGNNIELIIKKYNFSVVKTFCGHGIGENMHEDPLVPNYGKKNKGFVIKSGIAFAIEPMFCQFKSDLFINKEDGWTASTIDKGMAAHIEDTVILTDNGRFITTR